MSATRRTMLAIGAALVLTTAAAEARAQGFVMQSPDFAVDGWGGSAMGGWNTFQPNGFYYGVGSYSGFGGVGSQYYSGQGFYGQGYYGQGWPSSPPVFNQYQTPQQGGAFQNSFKVPRLSPTTPQLRSGIGIQPQPLYNLAPSFGPQGPVMWSLPN
ncbi:hypothetical protein [Planctomyces sp. SH-PL62]|uniref:hypothetical protein n=1 Tax=Planctomyces sp. SH-PL62 TaxID=1636152 RepID=UPI00078CB130|nr:hypothetical protein [Planctomyces sp. SH-PL62]AMV38055.1 hypothetical protein VT85_11500 [Planctomyces sp. SH-PL62]